MFQDLQLMNQRPEPFVYYTAEELWADPYTARKMLEFHLNESIDVSSRNLAFIEKSVDWIASNFGLNAETSVADFGCGPGLYTTRFAERGARVTGIDFSGNSLAYARKVAVEKKLPIKYIQTNYLEFETEDQFDLITMIMCDFCALSPEQRRIMLSKFHRFLKPDGAILLDVYSLNAFKQREECAIYEKNQLNGFWSPDEYYGFVNTFKYEKEKVVLDQYTLIEASRKRVVYNWLQYYSPDSLKETFEESGFEVTAFYADVAGSAWAEDAGEFATVAKKMKERE